MKLLIMVFVLGFNLAAFAQSECASSLKDLNNLMEHADFPKKWVETKNPPLILELSGSSQLSVRLHKPAAEGEWGTGRATVCKKGNAYVLSMANVKWANAPGILKAQKSASLTISFPSTNIMKAKGPLGVSFTFAAQ